MLHTVIRQQEEDLICAIKKLAQGSLLDEETVTFIKSFARPLEGVSLHDKVCLFATNFQARKHNFEVLQEMEGDFFIYKARDSGKVPMLNDNLVPSVLKLKKHCKVMLTCNLYNISPKLVNGSQGSVLTCSDDAVEVFFPEPQIKATVTRHNFAGKYQYIFRPCKIER